MKLILPVAGRGTRVHPHSFSKPKPFFKILNKPAICHIIDSLFCLDIEEIIFIVDKFNGDAFKELMPKLYPKYKFQYVLQDVPEGPAHALWLTKDLIKEDDEVFINFCDTLFEHDMTFLKTLDSKYDGVIFVKGVEDYQRFGVVIEEDKVMKFIVEKPDTPVSKLANIGNYYFRDGFRFMQGLQKMIDDDLKAKGEYYLPEAFMIMINDGQKIFVQEIDKWLDTGKIETILETSAFLLNGGVLKGRNVKLDNCEIGKNVSIGDNTILRNCKINNSIIGENTLLEELEIENSVIGDKVVLKKGGKVFNIGDKCSIE